MSTTYQYQTVASSANGPLIESLSLPQGLQLAYDYTVNYTAFLTMAGQLINQQVQSVEAHEPEGTLNFLAITGWDGQAANAANAINAQWQQGKLIGTDGKPLQAWPDAPYNSQIAWAADNNNTLELRWVKWEWQLYLVVFVLIAVVGYLVYRILTQGSWNLQTAHPVTSNATSGPLFGGVPFVGGSPFRVFWLPWYWDIGIAGAVVAGPYIYRQFVSVEESRAQGAEAHHEYQKVREEEQ